MLRLVPSQKVDAYAGPVEISIGWYIMQMLFGLGWETERANRESWERTIHEAEYSTFYEMMIPIESDEVDDVKNQGGHVYKFDGQYYEVTGWHNRADIIAIDSAINLARMSYGDLWVDNHLKQCVVADEMGKELYALENRLSPTNPAFRDRFYVDENNQIISKACNKTEHALDIDNLTWSDVGDGIQTVGQWIESKTSNFLDDYSIKQNSSDIKKAILEYGKLSMTKEELLNLLDIFEISLGYTGGNGEIHKVDFSERGKYFFEQMPIARGLNPTFNASVIATDFQRLVPNTFTGGMYLQVYSGGGIFPLTISDKAVYVKSTVMPDVTDGQGYMPFKLEWQFYDKTGPIGLIYDNKHPSGYYYNFNMRNLSQFVTENSAERDTYGVILSFLSQNAIGSQHRRVINWLHNSNSIGIGLGFNYDDIAADGRVGILGSLSNPFAEIDYNVRDRRKEIEELLKDLENTDKVDLLPQVKNDGLVEPYPIPRDIPADLVIDTSIPRDIVQDIELPNFPELPKFNTSPKIVHKFPFSIPFDLMAGIKLLAVEPHTPIFEIPINFNTQYFKFNYTLVLDFGILAPFAKFSRWLFTVVFVFFLALGTRKLIMA